MPIRQDAPGAFMSEPSIAISTHVKLLLLLRRLAPWSLVVPVFGVGVVILLNTLQWDRPMDQIGPGVGLFLGLGFVASAICVLVEWYWRARSSDPRHQAPR